MFAYFIYALSHCGVNGLKKQKQNRNSKAITYLASLQTAECCEGALPASVILQAAVQTAAVVRLFQALCVFQTRYLSYEDMQRFTELPDLLKHNKRNHNLLGICPALLFFDNLGASRLRASCPSANPPEGSAQNE